MRIKRVAVCVCNSAEIGVDIDGVVDHSLKNAVFDLKMPGRAEGMHGIGGICNQRR